MDEHKDLVFRATNLHKYLEEYVIQGDYGNGHGWEDLNSEPVWRDVAENFQQYTEAEPDAAYRIITRRVPNPDYGRFYEGQYVAVHPAHGQWARGFRYGTVAKVGKRWIHVRWSMNPEIVGKFDAESVAPGDGS
jgi:hypothetical protein